MFLQFACKYVIDDQQNTTYRVERLDGTLLAEREFSDDTGNMLRETIEPIATQDERDSLEMIFESMDDHDWSDFTFEIDV
jgi:hypothetical protein